MKRFFVMAMLVAGAWCGPSGVARAEVMPFQEWIPASACQVLDGADVGQVRLISGSWVFNNVGFAAISVRLICPIRVANFAVTATQIPLDTAWDTVELFYRDPDGKDTNYAISVEVRSVTSGSTGSTQIGSLSSNGVNSPPVTTDTSVSTFIGGSPKLVVNGQHYAIVTMSRAAFFTAVVRFTALHLVILPPS